MKSKIKNPNGLAGLLFAGFISVAFVWFTFGISFLRGDSSFWNTQVGDVAQYLAGFNMYFRSPWEFPLLGFDGFNYPQGTTVTFVDAIPIYSLFLKLFIPKSWAPFNPFGFWVGICFFLQGVVAWWILRELRVQNWLLLAALVLILLTSPSLMARLGHISLMSHWLLLFGIALYIRCCKRDAFLYLSWTLLVVLSFYINVYIFFMLSGMMLCAFLDLKKKFGLRDWLALCAPILCLFVTTALTLLPLPIATVTKEWGFGYYSMNFLAPITGGRVVSLGYNEIPGQYEGFNYLGLGVIICGVWVLLFCRDVAYSIVRNHVFMALLLCLFFIYSLSNQIYFGSSQIAVVNYPDALAGFTSQFRASGRFFWPVGYFALIFSLYIIYRTFDSKIFSIFLVFVVVVQLYDLTDRYQMLQNTAKREVAPVINYDAWNLAIGVGKEVIYLYPKFKCGKLQNKTILPIMRYAADKGLKLNTGYIARYTPSCDNIETEISTADPNRSVFVFSKSDYINEADITPLFYPGSSVRCTDMDLVFICEIVNGKRL